MGPIWGPLRNSVSRLGNTTGDAAIRVFLCFIVFSYGRTVMAAAPYRGLRGNALGLDY